MANTQTQDVELRIRATNYSKQTTDKVVEAMKQMVKAQDAQIESAKKGTTTTAQLEASYNKLESAAKALLGQQALTKLFQQQSTTMAELQTKLEAARKAQKDYSDALDPAVRRTAAQNAEIKKLGQAVTATEKQFMRAENRVASTTARMAEFGLSSATVTQSQQKIALAVQQANDALARQEKAINASDQYAAARRAAAEQIAQRELQIRVDNQFTQAERDLARQLQATAEAQRAANQAAANAARDAQYRADILFTNAEREAAEAIARKTAALQAQQAALRNAADAAERLARANVNASKGAPLPVSQSNVAQQLRDIASPADAAARSMSGLNDMVARLDARVAALRGPVQDYKGALQEATRAQAGLQAIAGQVDAYNRQIAAMKAARAEMNAAQVTVKTLIAEMRSGNAGDDITTRLDRAQRVLRDSASNVANLTQALRTTGGALKQAGVDTSNMTNAEKVLVEQATRATNATNALTEAFRRNGGAADQAGSRILNWFGGSGGRTTLSYTQRLRGEVLSLAAGFVGLNAVINIGKKSLDAYKINQAIMARLLISNGGDAKKAADDFNYLAVQADRIGFEFSKVAPTFTKFAIASSAAGNSTQQTRFIFEQIAASSVKARLSTDELGGVMKAFEQIMSKGTVQAEELRGQLGDRLPGAFQIAARAANMTVEEYTKAITLGEIGSDQVIKIARELGKTYGAAAEGAGGLLEAQARFDNATNRFLNSTAEGGFVQAYQALLTKMTTLLDDGSGAKLAQQLSAGFATVIDVVGVLADNLETLKGILIAIIGVSFIRWLAALPALFRLVKAEVLLLNIQMLALRGHVTALAIVGTINTLLGAAGMTGVALRLAPAIRGVATALSLMARAIPILGLALVAYEAGSMIVDGMDKRIQGAAQKAADASYKAMNDAEQAKAEADKAAGTKDEARLRAHYEKMRNIAVDALKERQRITDEAARKGTRLDIKDPSKAATPAEGTVDPGDDPGNQLKKVKKETEAADKRSEKLSRAARIKSAKEELQERLDIIDEPFQAMREKYKKSITDEVQYNEAIKMINASSQKAQAAERLKFQNEQERSAKQGGDSRVALASKIAQKLIDADNDVKKAQAEQGAGTEPYEVRREARVNAIAKAYSELKAQIEKEAKFAPAQAAADKAKMESLKAQAMAVAGINSDREEANRLVDEFNKKQNVLKANMDAINADAEMGTRSQEEATRLINEQISLLGPGIEAAGQDAVMFAIQVRDILDPAQFAEIVSTVGVGIAKNNVDARVAANNVNEAQRQMNLLLAQQQMEIEAINLQRKLGAIDANQEVDAINATTMKYATGIQFTAQQLLMFIQIARDSHAMTEEQLAGLEATAGRVMATSQAGLVVAKEWETTFVNSVVANGSKGFEDIANSMAKVITGQSSIADGFKGMMQAAGQFFAGLLRDIAMAIIKTQILKMLQSSTMFGGGVASAATAALGQHSGGVTGMNASFARRVDSSAFIGAPRYHTGGVAGFAPNEVPAILQKNEEVLTRDDPRHVWNGGTRAEGPNSGGGAGNRFILVDDRAGVTQAMASSQGEKVTMVHLKNNISTLKQLLKS